jgi:hypothetical protein
MPHTLNSLLGQMIQGVKILDLPLLTLHELNVVGRKKVKKFSMNQLVNNFLEVSGMDVTEKEE